MNTKRTIAILLASLISANAAEVMAQTYSTYGNTTYGSDGTTYSRYGNTTYGSDGTTSSRYGNTTYGSDGHSCSRYGNTAYCN